MLLLPGRRYMPVVSKFCYLGDMLSRSYDDGYAVLARMESAGEGVWTAAQVRLRLHLRVQRRESGSVRGRRAGYPPLRERKLEPAQVAAKATTHRYAHHACPLHVHRALCAA